MVTWKLEKQTFLFHATENNCMSPTLKPSKIRIYGYRYCYIIATSKRSCDVMIPLSSLLPWGPFYSHWLTVIPVWISYGSVFILTMTDELTAKEKKSKNPFVGSWSSGDFLITGILLCLSLCGAKVKTSEHINLPVDKITTSAFGWHVCHLPNSEGNRNQNMIHSINLQNNPTLNRNFQFNIML